MMATYLVVWIIRPWSWNACFMRARLLESWEGFAIYKLALAKSIAND